MENTFNMDGQSDFAKIEFPAGSQFPKETWEQACQRKAANFNSERGNLSGYDCPLCLNRGYSFIVKHTENGDNVTSEDCKCKNIRANIKRMEKSGLSGFIRQCRFENFECTEVWQKAAFDTAKSYAANPVGWLLLCGQSGSGKTHLCTAACRELLYSSKEVLYFRWVEDCRGMKGITEEGKTKLEAFKDAEYLYIDDLFKPSTDCNSQKVSPTKADQDIAFDIINHRYIKGLPTIISTELSTDELLDVNEAIGGRILEKSVNHQLVITKDRVRNYRLRNIKQV